MDAAHDGNLLRGPEIEVSGTPAELREFGKSMLDMKQSTETPTSGRTSDFYTQPLHAIVLELNSTALEDLVAIEMKGDKLCLESSSRGFQKLGQSILNAFGDNVVMNQHLHLDYFAGSQLIAPTRCNLILLAGSGQKVSGTF